MAGIAAADRIYGSNVGPLALRRPLLDTRAVRSES